MAVKIMMKTTAKQNIQQHSLQLSFPSFFFTLFSFSFSPLFFTFFSPSFFFLSPSFQDKLDKMQIGSSKDANDFKYDCDNERWVARGGK